MVKHQIWNLAPVFRLSRAEKGVYPAAPAISVDVLWEKMQSISMFFHSSKRIFRNS